MWLLLLLVMLVLVSYQRNLLVNKPCVGLIFPIEDSLCNSDTVTVRINDSFAVQSIISMPEATDLMVYKYHNGCWRRLQQFENLECQWGSVPLIQDVNGDGCDDIVLFRAIGARGGNVYNRVFLFDHRKGSYDYLKGSSDHANLAYDPKMQMIKETGYTATFHYRWFNVVSDSLVAAKGYDHNVYTEHGVTWIDGSYYIIDDTGGTVIVKSDTMRYDVTRDVPYEVTFP